MLAAAGDNDLRCLVGQAVFTLVLVRNRLPELRNARRWRIFRKSRRQRFRSGVLDVLRRVEIRFTSAKAHNVFAIGLHLLGFRVDSQSKRRGQSGCPLRDLIIHIRRRQIALEHETASGNSVSPSFVPFARFG